MFIFIVVFTLKRSKEKRKTQQEEHEKIKEYGESINEETRNKEKQGFVWGLFRQPSALNIATPTKQPATGNGNYRQFTHKNPPNTPRTLYPISCMLGYEEGDFDLGSRFVVK